MLLDKLFQAYAIYGTDWKTLVKDVTECGYMNSLSENAQIGFSYLSSHTCGDKFAHEWLEDFVRAWNAKENLPSYLNE
jgi:hypothetical protein